MIKLNVSNFVHQFKNSFVYFLSVQNLKALVKCDDVFNNLFNAEHWKWSFAICDCF